MHDHRVTLYVSLSLQLASLAAAATALAVRYGDSSDRRILYEALWIETAVNVTQLLWYLVALGVSGGDAGKPFGTLYRYVDWTLTTPCMIVSVAATTEYVRGRSRNLKEMFAAEGFAVGGALFANAIMLALGAYAEVVAPKKLRTRQRFRRIVVGVGFLPLAATFALLSWRLGGDDPLAQSIYAAMFAIWALYGIVALYAKQAHESAYYNALDCVAKNVFGLVLALTVVV